MASPPGPGLAGDMTTEPTLAVLTLALLIGAALTTGLTAGLFYVFAHAVMPGLATLPDADHLRGFQRIDAAIANPWMGLAFAGSPLLTGGALLLVLPDLGPAPGWLVAALVLTLVTIGITAGIHLPLNGAVQQAAPDFADASALRERFEDRWVTWNVVRTITSIASFLCLALALVLSRQPG